MVFGRMSKCTRHDKQGVQSGQSKYDLVTVRFLKKLQMFAIDQSSLSDQTMANFPLAKIALTDNPLNRVSSHAFRLSLTKL